MNGFFPQPANRGLNTYDFYACGNLHHYPMDRASVRERLLRDSAVGRQGIPYAFAAEFYTTLPSEFDLDFWTNLHQDIQAEWVNREGLGVHLVAIFIQDRIIPEMRQLIEARIQQGSATALLK